MTSGPDGPRACRPAERRDVIEQASRIFRPDGGDMGRDFPLLFAPENLDNLRVVVDADGRVVAHAGLCTRDAQLGGGGGPVRVACLGAIFTRADQRGRGWGSAVVEDALARARVAGAELAMVSGDRGLYQRHGFVPIDPATCWRPPEREGNGSDGVDVTAFDAADAPALAALYDAEPVRILRSAGDWKALLAASVLVAWPARIWVVRRAGRITAYLAVQQRGPSPRQGRVMEHAGDRDAVLAAAPQVSDAVVAPARDVELAHQARARGWSPSPLPLAMAARWLAPRPEPLPLPWYGLGYV